MGKKVEKALNSTKDPKHQNNTSAAQSVVQDVEYVKSPGFKYTVFLPLLTMPGDRIAIIHVHGTIAILQLMYFNLNANVL